ncbi:MAG TPA: ABC transporter substrate-binding protein [Xanthobacteraceae bacterium]
MISLSKIALSLPLVVPFALACGGSAAAQEQTVRVGMVRALSSTATMIAIEKGYFKDYGIKVAVEDIDSSIDALAPVAQGRLQVVEGGISAAYFNAIEKNLPVTIAIDRVSSPLNQKLILRADLKDKIRDIAQLKGRPLASNSRGAITNYEIGKIFQKAGLAYTDADIRFIPFTQMSVAFANKAVDAAFMIQPFASQVVDQGLGFAFADPDDFITPRPMTIAVSFVNTDWTAKNPELAKNFFLAALRGARDYCQAYHGAPSRKEVVDIAIRTGVEPRREMIDKYPWAARSPDGRVNVESMLDIQKFFVQAGLALKAFPAERLLTSAYSDYASAKLGPFALENPGSKLAGCR